jgi:hypothetical protein
MSASAVPDRFPMHNVPILLPDQTIESACAMAWAMNGWGRWSDALKAVFGSSSVHPERVLHGGISECFHALRVEGIENPETFIERHGFVSISKPFMDSQNYDYAVWKMVRKINGVQSPHWGNLIRKAKHYCPKCLTTELRARGFAYTHRSHQIVGTSLCHLHGERLAPIETHEADGLASHGFLTARTSKYGSTRRLDRSSTLVSSASACRCFARFVNATLDGRLPRISYELRHAIIVRQIARSTVRKRNRCNELDELQIRIDESFSPSFLARINAGFLTKLSDHASHIVVGVPKYVENPLANLAILSVLFKSPEEFVSAIDEFSEGQGDGPPKVINDFAVPPPFGLARYLFRISEMPQAGRRFCVDERQIRKYLAMRPSFASRRQQAIRKTKRRCARKALLNFIQMHPNGRKSDFRRLDCTSYRFLRHYDHEWLISVLPR